jgi:hypothetical protein
MEVNLFGFKINQLGRGCKVTFGQNQQVQIINNNKSNLGFGKQNANDSILHFPVSKIDDSDWDDSRSMNSV